MWSLIVQEINNSMSSKLAIAGIAKEIKGLLPSFPSSKVSNINRTVNGAAPNLGKFCFEVGVFCYDRLRPVLWTRSSLIVICTLLID
jgi:hypothetical protein